MRLKITATISLIIVTMKLKLVAECIQIHAHWWQSNEKIDYERNIKLSINIIVKFV